MAIRILISDDHRVAHRRVHIVLEFDAEFWSTDDDTDTVESVRLLNDGIPDIVLSDLLTHALSDIAATSEIPERFSEADVAALSHLLSATNSGDLSGAGKAADPPALTQKSATTLMSGANLSGPMDVLTGRETDVLRLLAQGQPNKEIARNLTIGEKTVKTHVSNILAKLGVHSRRQAALHAMQIGLVTPKSA
jgi:DNA-binding NarL/FixJ family response regulator